MRLLFVKDALAWPRSSGHDVHCYSMMRALARKGHAIALATARQVSPEAVEGLSLEWSHTLGAAPPDEFMGRLSRWQERFRSYWGVDENCVAAAGREARDLRADAVIAVGLGVLPYLGAVTGPLRVWYAADEWAWHHVSQVRSSRPATWCHFKEAAVKGLYERTYRSLLDRVWVVSDADRRAMRWVAGVADVAVIPNGVDADYYRPGAEPEESRSCVFWGRLDFGPNVQALEWFCGRVWPAVRRREPAARFVIYGFRPTPAVLALAGNGVEIVADLPDLRPEVARHPVAVFPFQSGGGIKNKLLEAAAMGKAIVCTPRATGGLRESSEAPLTRAGRPADWVRAILDLWHDAQRRRQLGNAARRWVVTHHSWEAAAEAAEASLARRARGGGRGHA